MLMQSDIPRLVHNPSLHGFPMRQHVVTTPCYRFLVSPSPSSKGDLALTQCRLFSVDLCIYSFQSSLYLPLSLSSHTLSPSPPRPLSLISIPFSVINFHSHVSLIPISLFLLHLFLVLSSALSSSLSHPTSLFLPLSLSPRPALPLSFSTLARCRGPPGPRPHSTPSAFPLLLKMLTPETL